jgi:hypothetical protein
MSHTIITSNKSLTDWAQIVQDISLAAALVRSAHAPCAGLLPEGTLVAHQRSPTPIAGRGRPTLTSGGDAMIVPLSTSTQKAASGWPPVADKNLRTVQRAGVFLKQKSRRVAAPRRSTDGTCEKPVMDGISLPRSPAVQHRTTLLVPPLAEAVAVPLLNRHTVHLHTGLYNKRSPQRRHTSMPYGSGPWHSAYAVRAATRFDDTPGIVKHGMPSVAVRPVQGQHASGPALLST